MLKNVKLSTKLIAGYLAVALIILIEAAVGYLQMKTIKGA